MFLRALAARDGHTSGSSEFTNCPASAHSAPTNTNRRHAASIRDHSIHSCNAGTTPPEYRLAERANGFLARYAGNNITDFSAGLQRLVRITAAAASKADIVDRALRQIAMPRL
jgi:hypothetical protein